jgi:hypothetical protein
LSPGWLRSSGIQAGSAADHQLTDWLEHRPSDDTFHKATRLISAMVDSRGGGALHLTADELIAHCDQIASRLAGSSASAGCRPKNGPQSQKSRRP